MTSAVCPTSDPPGACAHTIPDDASVLIIDDEPAVADALFFLLCAHGFSANVALNTDSALARLQERCVDVIITDLRMPGVDRHWTAQLRSLCPDACIVVISGALPIGSALRALRATTNAVLQKPVDERVLLQTLRPHGAVRDA